MVAKQPALPVCCTLGEFFFFNYPADFLAIFAANKSLDKGTNIILRFKILREWEPQKSKMAANQNKADSWQFCEKISSETAQKHPTNFISTAWMLINKFQHSTSSYLWNMFIKLPWTCWTCHLSLLTCGKILSKKTTFLLFFGRNNCEIPDIHTEIQTSSSANIVFVYVPKHYECRSSEIYVCILQWLLKSCG